VKTFPLRPWHAVSLVTAAAFCSVVLCGAVAADTLFVDNGVYRDASQGGSSVANLLTAPGPPGSDFVAQAMWIHQSFDQTWEGDITAKLWSVGVDNLPDEVLWSELVTLPARGTEWTMVPMTPYTLAPGGKVFAGFDIMFYDGQGYPNAYAAYDDPELGANQGLSYFIAPTGGWQQGQPLGVDGNLMVRLSDQPVDNGSTPEPASIVLLSASCGMFGLLRRRRARR
jgi:hypothetical protein